MTKPRRFDRIDTFSDDDVPAKPQPVYSPLVNALVLKINAQRLAGIDAAYARIGSK